MHLMPSVVTDDPVPWCVSLFVCHTRLRCAETADWFFWGVKTLGDSRHIV